MFQRPTQSVITVFILDMALLWFAVIGLRELNRGKQRSSGQWLAGSLIGSVEIALRCASTFGTIFCRSRIFVLDAFVLLAAVISVQVLLEQTRKRGDDIGRFRRIRVQESAGTRSHGIYVYPG